MDAAPRASSSQTRKTRAAIDTRNSNGEMVCRIDSLDDNYSAMDKTQEPLNDRMGKTVSHIKLFVEESHDSLSLSSAKS